MCVCNDTAPGCRKLLPPGWFGARLGGADCDVFRVSSPEPMITKVRDITGVNITEHLVPKYLSHVGTAS